nr:integrator complex subunit 11 [Tanacetum cinerariifolium]
KIAAKKRTTRASPAITTTTTIPITNAQLKALIDQGVADALAARDANKSMNGDDNHNSKTGVRRQAHLTRETVGHDVAYAMTWTNLKKMMTNKYCPRGEIKKLEVEMLNLKVKESDKSEKYINGLPDMIHGSVMASKPKTMQDAIEFASELMDKKISTLDERQAENKRKLDTTTKLNNNLPRINSYKLLPHRTSHAPPRASLIPATVAGYFNFSGEKRRFGTPQPASGDSPLFFESDPGTLAASAAAATRNHLRCRRGPLPVTKKFISSATAEIEAVDSDGHLRSCPSGLEGIDGYMGTRSCYRVAGFCRIRVGVVVARRLKDDVVRVTRRSDRIMMISVVIDGEAVHVINAYAPQVGLSDAEKKRFWDALDELRGPQSMQGMQGLPGRDMLIATQIGNSRCIFREEATQKGGDREARDFVEELKKGGGRDFRATVCEKLSALKEDMSARNADQMWNTLASVIRDMEKDSLGVASESARTHSTHKESWWFCEDVQTKVAMKQSRFKELPACNNDNQEDIDLAKERYKVAKRETKIIVAQAKDKTYKDLYRKLDSKEGENDIYKIAKARERKRMDIGNRLSEVIPIYKNKGDAQACSNYKGIKLLSHIMKLWERVIEIRLRRETRVSENQFGFMLGWSTTEAIHLLGSLMEKYMERQIDLHMAFLDLEKACDSVSRKFPWRTLRDKGTPKRYSKVIKDIYDGVKTRERTIMGKTEFFLMEVGLYQGSAIKSAEGLNIKIDKWMEALEDNGLRVSIEKMKYLKCDFDRVLTDHKSSSKQGGSGRIENAKMMEGRLRWFVHVKRRPETTPVRRVEAMLLEGSKRRGRPKLRWEDRLKEDMKELLLFEDMTSDGNA